MKTITLNRARYTVRDDRHSFLSDILKLTGKHKPVKSKGQTGACIRRTAPICQRRPTCKSTTLSTRPGACLKTWLRPTATLT